uniref:Tc1-like transposase DDE domain-containing protein n=1 Tax=Anopheles funestus TaxID=62324 RepID=A0A4Y0BF18_ANOFN
MPKKSTLWKRITCIMMIRAGRDNRDIMECVQCSLNTVKAIRNEMGENSDDDEAVAARKPHSQRRDCVRTDAFLADLQARVMENPGIGIRPLARAMGVAPSTMKMALNDDLRYFSYKRRRGQLLTEKGRERRLGNAKTLLNLLKHPVEPGTLWFFSSEKNFCQDQKVNTQNNRWLAYCAADVPRVPQTKFPQTVMVFSCVSSEGDVMPPHFFEQGLRQNADGYISMLDTFVKPWITRVANGRPYVFQQDSAPCHTASKTIKWLAANFNDFTGPNVWPPSSPDLNPMDYFVWGAVERDTNRTSSNTKAELMAKIRSVFAALPRETVARACSRLQRRVEAVIEAEGGYFE